MGGNDVFHFIGIHMKLETRIMSFFAISNREPPLRILVADVAGFQPTVAQHIGGFSWIIPLG